jgi:hypothetical protein
MIILLVLVRCAEAVLSTTESRLYDPALNDIQLMLDHLAMLKENRLNPSRSTVAASNLENFHLLPLNEKLTALEQPPITSKDQYEFLSEDEQTEFLSIHSTLEAAIQILEPTSIKSQFRGGGQQRHPLLS